MENERFNMSLRKFLKHVGVTSQQEIERVVRERTLEGKGTLRVYPKQRENLARRYVETTDKIRQLHAQSVS